MKIAQLTVALLAALVVPSMSLAQETLPPNTQLARIEAQPATITLSHKFAYAQVILTGVTATGERYDVTRLASLEKPAFVAMNQTGLVRPTGDGAGELRATFAGQRVSIPVQVTHFQDPHTVSFVRDVMPVLSRVGCNAGTCHGAQEGKNGFKLSLRGYDPIYDHRALTDDLEGRRFNRAAPETSLMLLKLSGGVPHVGGVLAQPGDPAYELLRSWIAAGVQFDGNSPRVSKLDIFPKSSVIALPRMKQQMAVYATYTDGSVSDVTAEAFIESSNGDVATSDRAGTITALRRGELAVMARYEGSYAAATLVVMGDRSGFEWKQTPTYNWIDELVYEKLRQVKVLPSDVCTDADFIRRLFLDLTGLPPLPEEVRAFLANPLPSRQKREALVDRLVGSPEYIEHWTNKWADLLQVNRKFLGEQGATAFRAYIRQAIASNKPYDKFVHDILTASGSNLDNPAASYLKILRDPEAAMENTTQPFLAVRFNCNKCHDHPFERWTQNQYYELAAYFAQVNRAEDPRFKGQRLGGTDVEGGKPVVEIITDVNSGDVKHVRTGALAPPSFPYKHADTSATSAPRREQLAHWITSRENQYFAKSYANRVWAYLLGTGLIEPIDDIRAGNPATNPKLLERLTNEFVASGFNVQELVRTICKSRTYQHSVIANKWNADDDVNYSRAIARRLPAEVLYDTIHRATGAVSRLPGLPNGSRAVQLMDSAQDVPGGFLDLFGKPARESACECERTGTMMLGPVLNMVNGPVVADAIKDSQNRVARLLQTEKDDKRVVEELYLAVLCRLPTAEEVTAGVKALREGVPDYQAWLAEADRRQVALQAHEKALDAAQAKWEEDLKAATRWEQLEMIDAKASNATLTKQQDGTILAGGKNEGPELYTIHFKTKLAGITAIQLETLTHPSFPANGPGRAPNGNFVLNELKVSAQKEGSKDAPKAIELHKAQADYSQPSLEVANAIDGNEDTGWAIHPQMGKPHRAMFETKAPAGFAEGTIFTVTMSQRYVDKMHNLGHFRFLVTSSKTPALNGPPDPIALVLNLPPAKRSAEQQVQLRNYYRSLDPTLPQLVGAVNSLGRPVDPRQPGAQDLVWAMINSKAFQFNH